MNVAASCEDFGYGMATCFTGDVVVGVRRCVRWEEGDSVVSLGHGQALGFTVAVDHVGVTSMDGQERKVNVERNARRVGLEGGGRRDVVTVAAAVEGRPIGMVGEHGVHHCSDFVERVDLRYVKKVMQKAQQCVAPAELGPILLLKDGPGVSRPNIARRAGACAGRRARSLRISHSPLRMTPVKDGLVAALESGPLRQSGSFAFGGRGCAGVSGMLRARSQPGVRNGAALETQAGLVRALIQGAPVFVPLSQTASRFGGVAHLRSSCVDHALVDTASGIDVRRGHVAGSPCVLAPKNLPALVRDSRSRAVRYAERFCSGVSICAPRSASTCSSHVDADGVGGVPVFEAVVRENRCAVGSAGSTRIGSINASQSVESISPDSQVAGHACAAAVGVEDVSSSSIHIDSLLRVKRVRDVRVASAISSSEFIDGIVGVAESSSVGVSLPSCDGCKRVLLPFQVAGRTSNDVQRSLRRRIASDLADGQTRPAFASLIDNFCVPRCDQLELMMSSMPGLDQVDWNAPSVESGLDIPLWMREHASHCSAGCSVDVPSARCYFSLMHHFLSTGFSPSVLPGRRYEDARPPTMAFVELWRAEPVGCEAAFRKWLGDASAVVSAQIREQPHCVFPLLPVVRTKCRWRYARDGTPYKVRLCMDFTTGLFNELLAPWPFRYRGLDDVASTVRRGDWMCTIDISNFFLRLPASERFREFQCFQEPSTYAATSALNNMPSSAKRFRILKGVIFGLKTAPAWASCVSAELVRILEHRGVRVAGCFVDDLCLVAESKAALRASLDTALALMTELGLPPAASKTSELLHSVVFLGMGLDSSSMRFSISDEHRRYAADLLKETLVEGFLTKRRLQSLAGVLTWLASVLVEGRPRRNRLYEQLRRIPDLPGSARVAVSARLRRQLSWWQSKLGAKSYSGSRCWETTSSSKPVVLLRSDASGDLGWGLCADGFHFSGPWPAELLASSNMLFKEAFPVVLALMLLAPHKRGSLFGSALDNAGAAFSFNSMCCRDEDTLGLLRLAASTLVAHDCVLVSDWVRRGLNGHSDLLSRVSPTVNFPPPLQRTRDFDFPFVVRDVTSGEMRFASVRLPRSCGSGMVGL